MPGHASFARGIGRSSPLLSKTCIRLLFHESAVPPTHDDIFAGRLAIDRQAARHYDTPHLP